MTSPHPITPLIYPVTADISPLQQLSVFDMTASELRHILAGLPFAVIYDFVRSVASSLIRQGLGSEAAERIEAFDALATRRGEEDGPLLDIHAALMQILTAVRISIDDIDGAMTSAASALSLLSQSPKRKDEPFLSVLAALLHDISIIHCSIGEYRQAERDIEKSLKILERLSRQNPARYSPAQMLAVSASTAIYRSRMRQANLLAHYRVATDTYMDMLKSGDDSAANALIESLSNEGRTLARMGKQRDAVQYFTRALKYLNQIEAEFSLRQLQLSVDLGEALISIKASRDKGVHLLNTMLHKATKLQADEEHRRIVDVLLNARSGSLDILGFWHKIFPR